MNVSKFKKDMCKDKSTPCRECSKVSGTMKKRKSSKLNSMYVGGLAAGVIASPVAAELASRVVPASQSTNAVGITGAIVAGAGYYLSEKSGTKSQFVKGLGHGMIAGGINLAVGAGVRNAIDGIIPASTNPTAANNAIVTQIRTNELAQRARIAA